MLALIRAKHLLQFLPTAKVFGKISNPGSFVMHYLGFNRSEIRMTNGLRFVVRPKSTDVWHMHEIMIRDDYRLKKVRGDIATIIDVGANIGVFSLCCAKRFKHAKVFAFEPEPANYKLLKKNIRMNNSNVTARQYIVADKTGKEKLYLSQVESAHSIVGKGPAIELQSISLEDIFKQHRVKQCTILKVDIEGGEYKVLYRTPRYLFRKIDRILMEFHNIDEQRNGKTLKRFLEQQGFHVRMQEGWMKKNGFIYARSNKVSKAREK